MKKLLLTLCLICSVSYGQSWQWGKRGGSIDMMDLASDHRQEEVYGIVTDSNKNIYTISYVGKNNLNVDGNPKTYFGDNTTLCDIALSSFACDGTYRWSKIIGGGGYDVVNSIQIDVNNNIYITGMFAGCQDNTNPPRIENDLIISQFPQQDCGLIFIAKFDSNGTLLWIRRPQPSSVSAADAISLTGSFGLSTDYNGNSYWFVGIPPGVYANGALTVTGSGTQYYILKYDAAGNFVGSTYLDMQLFCRFQFFRNPNDGKYYFTGTKTSSSDIAVLSGQTPTHSAFLWCYNDQGQLQWLKESTGSLYGTIFWFNYVFDSQNNIYIGGNILGANYESFLTVHTTATQFINPPFIIKLNPTADTVLWSTLPNRSSVHHGALALNGNELGVTTSAYSTSYTWGNQTLYVSATNDGTEAILARLDAATGACIGLSKTLGDPGYDDVGTSLAVDTNGDYIMGGGFGHLLTFTTNNVDNIGSQSDFFIAKYSTSVCSLHAEDFKEEGLELAPNPVMSTVRINTLEELHYKLYNISGVVVKEGTLNEQANTIDFSGMATGTYVLQTVTADGVVKQVKLVKE